jgi:hypothetical protein
MRDLIAFLKVTRPRKMRFAMLMLMLCSLMWRPWHRVIGILWLIDLDLVD